LLKKNAFGGWNVDLQSMISSNEIAIRRSGGACSG
jgi:hypothetical protein